MSRIYYLLLLAIVGLAGCKPDPQDLSALELGYDYFPTQVGSYIVYEVDSTYHGITEETFTYQIKEEIFEEYVDAVGQPAYKVRRYLRHYPSQPWVLMDVWTSKRTTTAAERVEENQRYIKLEFPVEEGGTWFGNAYTTADNWQYTYEQVDQPADIGELEFDRALRVSQRNNVNLVDEEVAYEIYAYGIGLVYKRFTDIEYQGGDPSGVDVRYRAIAYSFE